MNVSKQNPQADEQRPQQLTAKTVVRCFLVRGPILSFDGNLVCAAHLD